MSADEEPADVCPSCGADMDERSDIALCGACGADNTDEAEREAGVTVTDITVRRVDVPLLRKQLDWVLAQQPRTEEADGLIALLEGMLDVAEGYA